jgi:polyisoprenoid-binding protein YceI
MATAPAPQIVIPAATWGVDPVHSHVGYEVKHLGISTFRGRFTGFAGRIATTEGALARLEGTVAIDSHSAPDPQLAGHLLSPDFFDAERYPEGRFVSTAVRDLGDGAYSVLGDLTLRGVTRPVELAVQVEGVGADPYFGDRISLSARGEIDRTEYGISWNSTLANGMLAVSERVRLVLDVEAVREAPEAA